MIFPNNYFKEEVRDSFRIEELMKRAWGAEIEVLEVIDKICKKYNKTCVIEFKYDFSDKQLLHVLKTIKWHRYLKKCIFISFNESLNTISKVSASFSSSI